MQLFWLMLTVFAAAAPPSPAPGACWKTLAPIAGGSRQEHAVAVIGQDIYILGGFQGATVTKAVEKYNIKSNSWTTVAPLPVAVHHANVAVVNNEIYLLGSLENGFGNGVVWPPLSNTYKYSPSSQSWTRLGTMPNPRGSSVVGVYNDTVYLAGGLASMGQAVDTVSAFNVRTNVWTTRPDMRLPERRDHAGGSIVGNEMFVVGGRLGSVTTFQNTVWKRRIDVADSKWSSLTSMPTARGGIATAATNAQLFVFGGEGNPARGSRGVFPETEVLNLESNTWTRQVAMKIPRHGNGAVAVDGQIYIPGGGLQQSGGNATPYFDAFTTDCPTSVH